MKLSGQPIYTVDACDNIAGIYADNAIQFIASADYMDLEFEFLIGEVSTTVKIDNVVVKPIGG